MKDVFAAFYLAMSGMGISLFFCIHLGVDMKTPSFVSVSCFIFCTWLIFIAFYSIYYSIKIIKELIN